MARSLPQLVTEIDNVFCRSRIPLLLKFEHQLQPRSEYDNVFSITNAKLPGFTYDYYRSEITFDWHRTYKLYFLVEKLSSNYLEAQVSYRDPTH